MSLQQQLPDGTLRVRWVRVDAIGVEQQERRSSFLLGTGEIRDWSPRSHGEIDEAALDAALALQPGSGPRQRFLPPRLQALLLARGIGVECMDNGAAARTFNLLADEGRRVVAAFLIEAG
jgi:uncharacterized protein